MPTKSTFPDVEIPNVDLWTFMFGRKDQPWPDDKGLYLPNGAFMQDTIIKTNTRQ